jgi:hypothetical protein
MAPITIRAVTALPAGKAIWDGEVRGFGVRRQIRDAFYVLRYPFHGKTRVHTIGRHGSPWTPETARKEAKRILWMLADGEDPKHSSDTVAKLVAGYLPVAKKRLRPRSYVETERYLLKAWTSLHGLPASKVARRDVAAGLAVIEAERGAVSAIRARAVLSTMFKWAIGEGHDIVNPVTGTNQPTEPKARDRVLSDPELAAIWKACGDDDYGRIVRLLLLTVDGCQDPRKDGGAKKPGTTFAGFGRAFPSTARRWRRDFLRHLCADSRRR